MNYTEIANLIKANKLIIETDERDGVSFQLYVIEGGDWVLASPALHAEVHRAMARKAVVLGADADDYEGCPKFLKLA